MDIPCDIRKQLCEQLLDYISRTPERASVAEQVLQFVCNTPDCFERTHVSGHITGSAWLINPAGDKTLLTLHRKLKLWVQPGGHADGDGNVLHVAMREAQEESGIDKISAASIIESSFTWRFFILSLRSVFLKCIFSLT